MAGVKLMVMYPRPKDVDAFEKVYQKEHVPMAVEKLKGKTFLSHRRSPLPFHGSIASLRRFRRRPADGGTCRENIIGRTTGGDDRRRRVVQLLTGGLRLCDFRNTSFNFPRPHFSGARSGLL
jgi:hypothetical protein